MKVTVETEVTSCVNCPNYSYDGESFSESVYSCKTTGVEVYPDGEIHSSCPFIASTMEKLQSFVKPQQ